MRVDLFLICDNGSGSKFFQIWINNKDGGFKLAQQGPLPSGTQVVSFADIGGHRLSCQCASTMLNNLCKIATVRWICSSPPALRYPLRLALVPLALSTSHTTSSCRCALPPLSRASSTTGVFVDPQTTCALPMQTLSSTSANGLTTKYV